MSTHDRPAASPRAPHALIGDALDSVETVLGLTADFDERQQQGPMIPIVNPAIWELGHVAWFIERWTLRNLYEESSLLPHADEFYDSAAMPHDLRWGLSLPSWEDTREYLRSVAQGEADRIGPNEPDALERYFIQLATFHTDFHAEAFTYTRQTFGFSEPDAAGIGVVAPASARLRPPRRGRGGRRFRPGRRSREMSRSSSTTSNGRTKSTSSRSRSRPRR